MTTFSIGGACEPSNYEEIATACACLSMRKASRAITQFYDAALEPSGIRATQFVILVTVASAKTPSLAELARLMVMDPSTLSRNIKPLQAAGYLRDAHPQRRRRTVMLTDSGREVLGCALPLWHQAQARFLAGLGQDNWMCLQACLAATIVVTREKIRL